ncbi:MAG: S-methyl-5'-thioadenosine phosphorylase [Desulfurococcales archaeon]|nr:S-methyl-5'-thioadenosine phosphorylase [Desulfurococcales archaeon]
MTLDIKRPEGVEAHVGLIGGSGIYDPGALEDPVEVRVHTPYGEPSDFITVGKLGGVKVAFLPRHGRGHRIPPHMINYRANLWALKSLGVKWVLSVSAVGSLREDYKPGDLVVPDQFIDMTKNRQYTFFDGPITVHVSMADPFCEDLSQKVYETVRDLGYSVHYGGTYVCIEGPRFSTRAESRVWKEVFKADIIGMTLVPEVNLACELEMCYSTLAMVTDYDVWAEHPVTAGEVERIMKSNVEKARNVITRLVPKLAGNPDPGKCSCCNALKYAIV